MPERGSITGSLVIPERDSGYKHPFEEGIPIAHNRDHARHCWRRFKPASG